MCSGFCTHHKFFPTAVVAPELHVAMAAKSDVALSFARGFFWFAFVIFAVAKHSRASVARNQRIPRFPAFAARAGKQQVLHQRNSIGFGFNDVNALRTAGFGAMC